MRSVVTHFLLPHHTNNHRPRVLHVDLLMIYAIVLLLFHISIGKLHVRFPDILGYATSIYTQELLKYTNDEREKAGLAPLVFNEELSQAAKKKAEDMFAKNYWAHFGPEGQKPWDFITESGYNYTVAGENLAKNFTESKQVVDAWMASSSHKDNILKPAYRDIGFAVINGVLQGEETTLVVQMFGNTGSSLAQAPQSVVGVSNREVAVAQKRVEVGAAGIYSAVIQKPVIDIKKLTGDISFIFIGIMLGILALDAWIIARRRTVRVAGHNGAHMMFFTVLLLILMNFTSGSIL